MNPRVRVIKPQPGPQEAFMSTPADIAIYGGGAGGGKTWALLLEALRHHTNPEFGAVFFRRTSPQIRNEGGLWDESMKLYFPAGGRPVATTLDWTFPSGARISFRQLEYEKTKEEWQGSQICLECFDEITHFTSSQFWYLLTRNRSLCGVKPYVRATCNPDPDSWVAELIEWWIDQETGFPIPERAGVLRYFVRIGETLKWADNPDDLQGYTMINEEGDEVPIPPKSLTFIPALVTDNKILMKGDPSYVSSLMAQGTVDRERLMKGNWKIRSSEGLFQRNWFKIIDEDDLPVLKRRVRGWDLAATEENSPTSASASRQAATAGVLISQGEDGNFYIEDSVFDRVSPHGQVKLIRDTAAADGKDVIGSLPQDPGQAGKSQIQFLIAKLAGFVYKGSVESGDKAVRAGPLAAQAEAGNVFLVRGPWNRAFLDELEGFPNSPIKDQVDAASRAFSELLEKKSKGIRTKRLRFR